METFIVQLRQRVGTTESWTQKDPVLALAEFGMEVTITGKILFKLGDGVNKWSQLMYQSKDVYKQEFDNLVMEVANKINGDEVYVKSEVYTKEEVDSAIQTIINTLDTYSRSQIDTKLSVKSDEAETIARLDTKADKTEVESALAQKANVLDILSSLDTKADKDNTYTKTETDNALNDITELINSKSGTILATSLPNGNIAVSTMCFLTETDSVNTASSGLWILTDSDTDYNYWREILSPTNIKLVAKQGAEIISVSGVLLDRHTINTNVSDPITLVATITPPNATNKSLIWESSNTSVATVNNGVVTIVGSGVVNISVRTVDGKFSDQCQITKNVAISSITIPNPLTSNPKVGENVQLTASILPSDATNKNVVWSSSDPAVATVDDVTGIVTFSGVGNVTITARSAADVTISGVINFVCEANIILVNQVTIGDIGQNNVTVGDTDQLTAIISPPNATNKGVSWVSSNETVATVDNTGLVSFIGAGNVIITALTEDASDESDTVEYSVADAVVSVSGVTIDQESITIDKGSTQQLTATISPPNAANKDVSWVSSNEAVATVDNTGLVTAIGAGTVEIQVFSVEDNHITDSCTALVQVPVESISIDKIGIVMTDTPYQLTALIYPFDATNKDVIWSSSDPAVATVDSTGLVTALKSGSTIITATSVSDSSVSTSVLINCEASPIAVSGVTLDRTTFNGTEQSQPIQLVATVAPPNATNKNVVWSSSNEAVATVDNTGLVTFVGIGNATIIATTEDGDHTADCAIVLGDSSSILTTSCDVINPPLVASCFKGESYQLNVEVLPTNAGNKNVYFRSSNLEIATVDTSGLVTFVGSGTVRINIASADGGSTSFVDLIVYEWGYDFQISNTDYDFNLSSDSPTFPHPAVTGEDFYLNPDVVYELYYLGTTGIPNEPVLVPKEGIDAFAAPNPNGTYYINPDNFIVFGFGSIGTKNYRLVKRNV